MLGSFQRNACTAHCNIVTRRLLRGSLWPRGLKMNFNGHLGGGNEDRRALAARGGLSSPSAVNDAGYFPFGRGMLKATLSFG